MSDTMRTPDDILGYLSMSYMDSLGVFIHHPIFALSLFIVLFLVISLIAHDIIGDTLRHHPGILSVIFCATLVSTWVVILFMWSFSDNYPSKDILAAMLRDGVSINLNLSETPDTSVKDGVDFKKLAPEYVGGGESIFNEANKDKDSKTFSIGDELSNKELRSLFAASSHWTIQSFSCNKELDVGKRECFVFIKPADAPKKIFRVSLERLGEYGKPYHNDYLEQKSKARASYLVSKPVETAQ